MDERDIEELRELREKGRVRTILQVDLVYDDKGECVDVSYLNHTKNILELGTLLSFLSMIKKDIEYKLYDDDEDEEK